MNQLFSAESFETKDGFLIVSGRVEHGGLEVGDILFEHSKKNGRGFQIEAIEAYGHTLAILPGGMTGGLKLKDLLEGDIDLPCKLTGKRIPSKVSIPLHTPLRSPIL
ncbi:MAG: hypothetical protein ACSHYA_13775 [Opitutaceae bacterium]